MFLTQQITEYFLQNWDALDFPKKSFDGLNCNYREEPLSDPRYLICGVPQGSILGPLLFLLYVDDMPQALNCDLFFYTDDICLTF